MYDVQLHIMYTFNRTSNFKTVDLDDLSREPLENQENSAELPEVNNDMGMLNQIKEFIVVNSATVIANIIIG